MDDINELIIKFKNGDETVFKKILEKNIKLITYIAKRYRYFFSNLELDELIAEGMYGLLQAVKRYNKKKEVQFQTYAQYWIKKYVRNYVIKNYTIVKIPYNVFKNTKKILSFIDKDKQILPVEIAKKLKLDPEKVKDLLIEQTKAKKELSLDSYLDKEDEQETLYDIIPDTAQETVESHIQQEEKKKYVDNLLTKLLPQEAEIIKWRFGIIDHEHHTIKDIAKRVNLSPQKIKDMEEVAIMKLKLMVEEYKKTSGEI